MRVIKLDYQEKPFSATTGVTYTKDNMYEIHSYKPKVSRANKANVINGSFMSAQNRYKLTPFESVKNQTEIDAVEWCRTSIK